MKDKIIEKIKKCLALAKSSNANEAATALRQAQQLMAKHSISSEQVELSKIESVYRKATKAKNPPIYHQMLANVICKAFGVEVVYHQKYLSMTEIEFIGLGSQAMIASYAYEILFKKVSNDRSEYLKSLSNRFKRANKTRKADLFAQAWVNSVRRMVVEFAKPEGFKELVEVYKKQQYGNELSTVKKKQHKANVKDNDACRQGAFKGRDAQLYHGVDGEQQRQLENRDKK